MAIPAVLKSLCESGSVPVGTIISLMGNNAPIGYLKCDGTTYNIEDYQDLADYFESEFGSKNNFGGDGTTTFKVPDLRGEFLRGTGTNSHTDQGNGANVGTHQDATLPNFNADVFFHGSGDSTVFSSGSGNGLGLKTQRSKYRGGGTAASSASSYDGFSINPSLASSVYQNNA